MKINEKNEEGKLYLEKLGYRIVLTGIISGVMQLTEDIIW